MKPLRILTHGPSDSLNRLIESLRESCVTDIKKIKTVGSTYRGNPDHVILNWGSANRRAIRESVRIINEPTAVSIARNKLETLKAIAEYNSLIFTESKNVAKDYIRHGCTVYCRTSLTGSQGSGIVVARSIEELVSAPLYTVQAPVCKELRLHFFDGQMISYAQKKRMNSERREEEQIELSQDVRNLENGWVFTREGIELDSGVRGICFAALSELQLDFGAVDVGVDHNGTPYIFEVNTAPGLEGSTLEAYRDAVRSLLDE